MPADAEPTRAEWTPRSRRNQMGAGESTDRPRAASGALPVVRIGLAGGLVGMLCCVGPTVLALIGVVGAATAYSWAEQLYGGYAWWFRLGGLVVLAALVWWGLRRRRACSLAGARAARWQLIVIVGVAVVTYAVFYGLTTLAGTLAHTS